jgi:hypothetical protein
VGVKVVVESLEMIVAHRDILLRLLTRLVGSDCSYIGSWKWGGLQAEGDKTLVVLRDRPSSAAPQPPSYFVAGTGQPDRDSLRVDN